LIIATWNVNSVRARLPRVLDWLAERRPDVVCLQETKCRDEEFPAEALEDQGYHLSFHGQRTYNGVAILSKRPIEDVVRGLPDSGFDDDRRVLGCVIGDLMVIDVYVVNGQEVGSAKYEYKLAWLSRLREHLARLDLSEKVILTGDFNITFDDRDVYDPARWREKILCSTPEREALARITELGFVDAFRRFEEGPGHYTWWDFRTRAYPDRGLRIDHFLLSEPAQAACRRVWIDSAYREGERPSDHAPVLAEFSP
jgi:exodeoxyribonuclease III